jgi:hypothetical protein
MAYTPVSGLTVTSTLTGTPATTLEVIPTGHLTYEVEISNLTQAAVTMTASVLLPATVEAGDTSVTTTYTGSATGSNPSALALSDAVTLPVGGKVKYAVDITVDAATPVGTQHTPLLKYAPTTPRVGCDEALYVQLPTVMVIPASRVCEPQNYLPAGPGGLRPVNNDQALWLFMGQNRPDEANFIQDMLTAGVTLADVFRAIIALTGNLGTGIA